MAGLAFGRLRAAGSPPPPTVNITRNTGLNGPVWPVDLNGDGITDLVASDTTVWGNTQWIVAELGKGDGTFGAPIKSSTTGEVLAVGDFNQDGKRDLVVRRWTANSLSVVILPGNGDGTFAAPRLVATVTDPADVEFARVADIDGDGHADVFVASDGGTSYVYPGNGDFTFGAPAAITTGMLPLGGSVADVNGDGRPDIVVANHDGHSVSVFLNTGGFAFTASDIPLDRQANDVAVADVNRDGKADLLVAASHDGSDDLYYIDGYVYVLLGHGDGTFAAPAEYETRNGAWRIVVGDFNRDGVLDVATANRSAKQAEDFCGFLWDTVSILPGKTDGTFGASSSFSLGNQMNLTDWRYRDSVMSLAAVDVNGDHQPDLVVSQGAVLLNRPSDANWAPKVTASATTPDSTNSVQLSAIANDVDQDALTYQWVSSTGEWIEPTASPCLVATTGGDRTFTVTVDDGHGHTASSSVTVDMGGSGGGGGGAITITAPQTGETVTGGRPYTIRWTASSQVSGDWMTFTYSADNGATWAHIAECDNTVGSAGQCTWNNPGPNTTSAILEICDINPEDGCARTGPFTIVSATGLPDPWQSGDIGTVGAAGSATFTNGVFTVRGSGSDIWGTADAFQYVQQEVSNSYGSFFDLTTYVESVQNVNAWTKAGIMVRQSLAADAIHASLFVTPGKGVAFQRRTTTGGASVNTSIASITAPVWLRLTMAGAEGVHAFYKKNAIDPWTPIGSQSYSTWPATYAGLAVTSHAAGTRATASFAHVALDSAPPDLWPFERIGTTTGDGSDDTVNNTVSMTARGADIWGTADQFTYGSVSWIGDGMITTEVRLLDNTSSWAKAGPMFRDPGGAGAPYVALFVTPGKGIAMQYRATSGGASAQAADVAGAVPVYLRLMRQGNTFTGTWSTDLSTWHTVGSVSVALASSGGRAGLALTSHNTSVTANATFADLIIR